MMRSTRFGSAMVAGVAVAALVAVAATGPVAAVSGSTTSADVATSSASGLSAASAGFSDVDASNAFAADIAWFADAGITTGYADGTFRPLGSVTRGAMAAFLYRLVLGPVEPAACVAGPFADVAATYAFCAHVEWLAGTHITTGWPDGTYRPAAAVSRGAMAAFLYRLANDGATAPACTTAPFTDVQVGAQFCGEIAWFAEQGITTGWPDGTFRSGASISRQAMAAFLHRFVDKGLVPGDPEPDPDGVDPQVTIDDPIDGVMVRGTITARASWVTYADRARLDLLVDGTVVASSDAEPFDLVWDTTSIAEGPHDITIVGTDSEGRTGTSAPVTVFVYQAADPLQLLEDDLAAGTVTAEDYARYAVYRWFEPDLVPAQYRLPEGYQPGDLTYPMLQVLYGEDLDPAVRQEIIDTLTPDGPPDLPEGPLTPEQIDAALAPFRADDGSGLAPTLQATVVPGTVECATVVGWEVMTMPYDLTQTRSECVYVTDLAVYHWIPGWDNPETPGIDWPSAIDEQTDKVDFLLRGSGAPIGGPNGIPDYLDALHAGLSDAYGTYEDLGYGSLSDPIDVSIGDWSSVSWPWGAIDLRYGDADSGSNNPVYAARHELFHQFQYNFIGGTDLLADFADVDQSTNGWWLEATTEWAAHQAQEEERGVRARGPHYQKAHLCSANGAEVPCYSAKLSEHLGNPGLALAYFVSQLLYTADPQYGSFLFAEWLELQFGRDVILETWEAIADSGFPRAIDQIAAVLDGHGATLSDVVEAYHRANWTIPTSYVNPADPARDYTLWSSVLAEGRPGHTQLVAEERALPFTGTVSVGAGGAYYLALDLPESSAGALVRVQLEIDSEELPGIDVTVQAIAFKPDGTPCSEEGVAPLGLTEAGIDDTFTVVPGCPRVVLIVSHNEPELLIGPVNDPDLSVTFNYTITIEDAAVAGLLGADVEFVGSERMSTAEGLGTIGHLLDVDGGVHYWSMMWTMVGHRMGITPVGLTGVSQILSECHGADYGWALGEDGQLSWLNMSWSSPVSEVSDIDHLALAECGLIGYLVHRDGSLTYADAYTPGEDFTPVTGAVDVADAAAWKRDRVGGYAVTDDGHLLYLDQATATPVPDLDDVAAVGVNNARRAYARRADGTVVVLAGEAPLEAKEAVGITGAREIIAPFYGDQAFVLTDADRLFVVQCGGTDCSEVTVVDSGLTGVDTVSAGKDATAERPAWVLLRNGGLVELYVDGSGAHATRTSLTDVVDVDTVVGGGDRYAVRANGRVSTQAWLPDDVGDYHWGPYEEVAGVTNADDVLCSFGRCFVNLE